MQYTDGKPWFEVYSELASLLSSFYSKHRKHAGRELYSLCKNDREFFDENQWIHKFEDSWDIKSIDPLHVFSSVSGSTLRNETRTKRIQIYLRLLNSKRKVFYSEIDFKGCPAPIQVKLVGARSEVDQTELWSLFNKAFKNGVDCLNENTFNNVKKWYGVSVNIFTIILFWIRSDIFLPLDKNTLGFLIQRNKLKKFPESVEEYKSILPRKPGDICRLIAYLAYSSKTISDVTREEKRRLLDYFGVEALARRNAQSGGGSFKLLSIKPKEGCDNRYIKTLKPGVCYTFFESFKEESDNRILFELDEDKGIYNLDSLNVTLSAIVGKNGTGKSTIIELFMMAFNNIAVNKFQTQGLNYTTEWVPDLIVDLYYYSDSLYKVQLSNDRVLFTRYKSKKRDIYVQEQTFGVEDFNLENLFYSITINYSLHGLNSHYLGVWLDHLFHKNDAYQTPLVIEPFRKYGNIDINKQESLVRQRLLANLLVPELDDEGGGKVSLRYLKEGIKAVGFKLVPNFEKVGVVYESENSEYQITIEEIHRLNPDVIDYVRDMFLLNEDYDIDLTENSISVVNLALKYIIKKLANISITYDRYQGYFNKKTKKFVDLAAYLETLRIDKSHITFKLRQAINFLKYKLLLRRGNYVKDMNIDDLSGDIEKVCMENIEEKIDFLVPPSFFDVDIVLEGGELSFSGLSAGEKQKIYSISSLLYHLRNLDSVQYDLGEYIQYRFVNVFLDEVELCFHPELQRTFVNDLLLMIGRRPFENISGISICFITHSPFVLSDIVSSNIIFLEPDPSDNLKSLQRIERKPSFSANIHELLNDGFFMSDSIGSYAKSLIREIVDFHARVYKKDGLEDALKDYEMKKDRFKFIVDSVADSYISNALENHIKYIEESLYPNSYTDIEIRRLENRLRKLKEGR